jgi:hypothetical protein
MKNGYLAGMITGAIAGTAAGISVIFPQSILSTFGFITPIFLEALLYTATVHIGFNTIFGVAFGIIYSRFYDVIPNKGIKKGLVYGLILYIAQDLWPASYYLVNGNFTWLSAFLFSGIFVSLTYGFVQGALYEGTKHPEKIEYNSRGGMTAGAVAGLIGGIAVFALQFMNTIVMGIRYSWFESVQPIASIANLAAIEIVLMVVWGTIFSALFVLFFIRIPGKGIVKGLYFGFILCLLCVIRTFSWGIPYAYSYDAVIMSIITYSLMFIMYGLVLGYLYKK